MTTRRTFSASEKMEILNEGMQPGAVVTEICRKHGIVSSAFWMLSEIPKASRNVAEELGFTPSIP